MTPDRREFLTYTLAAASAAVLPAAMAQGEAAANGPDARDRVFITNEDSNTLVVIDPRRNVVDTTINLTSFDEDPRLVHLEDGIAPRPRSDEEGVGGHREPNGTVTRRGPWGQHGRECTGFEDPDVALTGFAPFPTFAFPSN